MIHIHWILLVIIIFASGFFGILAVALSASRRISELILGNRRLRDQRDSWKEEALRYKELLGKDEP